MVGIKTQRLILLNRADWNNYLYQLLLIIILPSTTLQSCELFNPTSSSIDDHQLHLSSSSSLQIGSQRCASLLSRSLSDEIHYSDQTRKRLKAQKTLIAAESLDARSLYNNSVEQQKYTPKVDQLTSLPSKKITSRFQKLLQKIPTIKTQQSIPRPLFEKNSQAPNHAENQPKKYALPAKLMSLKRFAKKLPKLTQSQEIVAAPPAVTIIDDLIITKREQKIAQPEQPITAIYTIFNEKKFTQPNVTISVHTPPNAVNNDAARASLNDKILIEQEKNNYDAPPDPMAKIILDSPPQPTIPIVEQLPMQRQVTEHITLANLKPPENSTETITLSIDIKEDITLHEPIVPWNLGCCIILNANALRTAFNYFFS